MLEKLKKIPSLIVLAWKNITIEPVIFLYLTSVGLISVIRPNLLLDKACRIKLNLTDEICDNLSNLNETSEYYNATIEVQKVVADYETTLSLAAALPRVAFTLLAGPWSDRHGRRFWQYRLWSFQRRDTKFERFLAKNQLYSNEITKF